MRQLNLNIQQTNNLPQYKYNQSFGYSPLLSSAFMAIDKHEIIGVSAIDLCSMVIPRSLIDFTRNKEAGIETTFRESSSTATHAAIGLAGLGAAALLGMGLNREFNVDFKNITANSDTIDGLAKVFKQVVDESPANITKEQLSKKFLNKVFTDVKGLAGNAEMGDKQLWYALQQQTHTIPKTGVKMNVKGKIIDILLNAQKSGNSYKLPSETLSQLEAYLNIDIPSTQTLHVKLGDKIVATKGSHFIADVHSLTKAFTQDKVIASFREAKNASSVKFVQHLEKLGIRKTVLGLAAICAVALSMQTFNRHMTKKRTGKDGFVGDPDYDKKKPESQNSPKRKNPLFIPLKILSMLGMGFFIFKTLNASSLRDLASKLQFKGSLPTMNQIKVVYGSTILGRWFASSDSTELRESVFRDFLGFTNFLVLGALVTKCFVNWKNKALINYDPNIHGKGLWNWLKNSTIKTHQEVINESLKHNVIKDKGILSLKEVYKNNWIHPNGTLANKLATLSKANLIGILYSCIALGIFVPLINKYVTESKKKKHNAMKDRFVQELKATHNIQEQAKDVNKEKTQKIISDFLSTPKTA